MTELITSSDLADFAAVAKTPLPTEIIAEQDKFLVRVTIKNQVRTLAAIVKGKTIRERKFPTLGAASSFLMNSNILKFEVNAADYTKPTAATRAPANQARMREMHKIAKHTEWLRGEIEASRADPRPSVSNEEANRILDAHVEQMRILHTSDPKSVARNKKVAAA